MTQKVEPLSSRLRRLREAKGWTQRRLAEAVGVAPQTIGHLETGHVGAPKARTLLRLAEALGVDFKELLEG